MLNRPHFCRPVDQQAKNEADTAIYSTEKSLNEYKSKLPQVRQCTRLSSLQEYPQYTSRCTSTV